MRLQLTLLTLLSASAVIETQEAEDKVELEIEAAVDSEPEDDIAGEVGVEPSHTIFTGSGPLKGRRVTLNDKVHFEFLGIPYAEPPVGRLRFLPPVPVQPWTSQTLEATKDGPPCLQPLSGFQFGDLSAMTEDCLSLNIFTTDLADRRPVMFWIHGGGFTSGSKDIYRMRALIEEGVVLVTLNYRLHALGFLSFGNDVVSGNMGLRDQQLALQWVRYNIQEFGGDPDKITIFGESAGAMSVQAQVLSPYNAGLLSGAIAQSGSILQLSSLQAGNEKRTATAALKALGCPTGRDRRSLQCLQRLDMKSMIANITDDPRAFFNPEIVEEKFAFWPVVDNYASNPFLPLDPLEALKTGQYNRVPYMTGVVKNEGVLLTGGYRLAGVTGAQMMDKVLQLGGTGPLGFIGKDERLRRIAGRFYNHPTGDTERELEQPAVDLLSDIWFGTFDQKSVELMSRYSRDVYNYYLTQQTNNSLVGPMFNIGVEYTPIHGDDLAFLISKNSLEDTTNLSEEEKMTAKLIVHYWTNFAKYGNPSPPGEGLVPTWYPVSPNRKVNLS